MFSINMNYNLLTVITLTGAVTTHIYDELNRNTAIEEVLSETLSETDEAGGLIVTYTRADTLISQIRDGEVSYYLYDGHGDVRGLSDDNGNIIDTDIMHMESC